MKIVDSETSSDSDAVPAKPLDLKSVPKAVHEAKDAPLEEIKKFDTTGKDMRSRRRNASGYSAI